MPADDAKPQNDRELVLSRLLDAPREKLFRCWTEPALITKWFTPPPWTTPHAEFDLRPGGTCKTVMRGPNGEEVVNIGVYLEIIPNEKLVFTDAFERGWVPKDGAPFMLAELTFADEGGKTRYVARVRHWSREARAEHENMGFHAGWGVSTDQLEAVAKTL